jgi:hypothetical protein
MTVYKTPQNRRPPWIVNMLGHAIRPGGLLFWEGVYEYIIDIIQHITKNITFAQAEM